MLEQGRDGLYEWFLPRLAAAWENGTVGTGHIDEDRYVQWAGSELGLQIECSSNRYLEGDARLTRGEVRELRRRG